MRALSGAKWAPTEPKIVVNAPTGLAMSGFDPVAYFTDGKPVFGRPELELNHDGAVWRFRNEGNRAAFANNPEIYLPAFRRLRPGRDIARGARSPATRCLGRDGRAALPVLRATLTRAAFLADPERIVATPSANGRTLDSTLGR